MILAVVLITVIVTAAVAVAMGYADLRRQRRELIAEAHRLSARQHEVQVAELALGAMVGEVPTPVVSVN